MFAGVAHETEADDVYNGFFIPKGTRVLPLDWAFLRNPDKYPDPDLFRPERWLEPGWPTFRLPLTQYPTIKGMSSFGWGQRQCLGMSLTQDELIVACGALAWCFNLKPKRDPVTGRDLPVPLDKSNSLLIIKPDPFQMAFEPRSPARREEALRLWEEARSKDAQAREDFLRLARGDPEVAMEIESLDEKRDLGDGNGDEKHELIIQISRVSSGVSSSVSSTGSSSPVTHCAP